MILGEKVVLSFGEDALDIRGQVASLEDGFVRLAGVERQKTVFSGLEPQWVRVSAPWVAIPLCRISMVTPQ